MYRVAAAALKSSIRSSTAKKLVSSRVIYSRNYVAKDISFGNGPRGAMTLVVEPAEAVKVTMGPKGYNAIMEQSHDDPKVTKDGGIVAKSIDFKEKAKNVGLALVIPNINIDASAKALKATSNCSELLSYMGGLDGEQNQLINKLVNFTIKEGKKTRARAILYQTFHRLAQTDRDIIKLMVDAIENIKPICEVKKVRRARTIYDVPGIVGRNRQQTLAIRWILEGAFKRRISYKMSLEKCLFDEIVDAYRKRGIARTKRESLHELASNKRSFARFRWW